MSFENVFSLIFRQVVTGSIYRAVLILITVI